MSDIATADIAAEATDTGTADLGLDAASADTSTLDTGTESVESVEQESAVPGLFEYEGTQITLDEARNGYLRQSDYTRKTQELAEQRSRLAQAEAITAALENDPVATLQALSEAFNVDLVPQVTDPYEGLDPDQARIAAIEAKLAAQEEAQRQAAIQTEVSSLRDQFGEVDESALFAHAIKGNFPSLRAAYADMQFDSLVSRMGELEARKAEEAKREEAKRAANVVQAGTTRAGAAQATAPEYGSIRDAYLAALKAHGAE